MSDTRSSKVLIAIVFSWNGLVISAAAVGDETGVEDTDEVIDLFVLGAPKGGRGDGVGQ